MSFFKVIEPNVGAVQIADLGITIAQNSNVILSNQFSVNDLYLSADLEAAIIHGALNVQIDYGTGFAAVAAVDYTNRDALSAFLNVYEISNENNNEKLVNGADASALHNHDTSYFTKTQFGASTGAALIHDDPSTWTHISGANVQAALNSIDAEFAAMDLDGVYTNDADGILNINGASKPLELRSDNANAFIVSRKSGADLQQAIKMAVGGAPSLLLGALPAGALGQMDVHVLSNLVVDGNFTVTGKVTDTQVDNLAVTNANIKLRSGAETIAGADASLDVVRGTSGPDTRLLWSHAASRWKAGLVGSEKTIALLEADEVVTGDWEFQGKASTAPSLYLTDKGAAPSTDLGASTQIPLASINNRLALYDKSRSKWFAVERIESGYVGRDSQNNANEYLRYMGQFTSNQSSERLMEDRTLVGMSVQFGASGSATVRVRKNGSASNLASLVVTSAQGAKQVNTNVDFSADDVIQVFIEGSSIARPVVKLLWAPKLA